MVLVNHTYEEMGEYNVSINIWNAVTSVTYHQSIFVQPNLVDYIVIDTVDIPKVAPADVSFAIKNIKMITSVVIQMTCLIDWGDNSSDILLLNVTEISLINHTYNDRFTDTQASFNCFNNVSVVSFLSEDIILRDPISGLQIVSQDEAFPTLQSAYFNVSMETGSHTMLLLDFGNGSSVNYTNRNILSSSFVWLISHVYATPGNFTVHVTATNERFQSKSQLQVPIFIQNVISNITIEANSIHHVYNSSVFEVRDNTEGARPTNVYCRWSVNNIVYLESYTGDLTTDTTFTHNFKRSDIGAANVVGVICYNLVSQQSTSLVVHVEEMIHGILTAPVMFTMPKETFDVSILAKNGSHMKCIFDFGNNVTKEISHPNIFANTQVLTGSHYFNAIGNYSVTITCFNLVSTNVTEVLVSVRHKIEHLTLFANESVLHPPATVDHIIRTGVGQRDLHHLWCQWSFSNDDSIFTYIQILDNEHPFHLTKNHTLQLNSSSGSSIVTVNCTNQVSEIMMQASTEILLDAVIIESLQSMPPVWYTNISTVVLKIKRLGKHSCFIWDMGDGTKYIYGLGWCRQYAGERQLKLSIISTDTVEITQNHIYNTWGNFTIVVSAFNHVSTDYASVRTVVKDWYCNKPIMSYPRNYTNISSFAQFRRGEDFSVKPDVLIIDCMKSLNRTKSTLDIYKLHDGIEEKVLTLFNETEFNHFPRMLDIGKYVIKVHIAMHGSIDFSDTTEFYIEIIPTPLVVDIQGKNLLFVICLKATVKETFI